MLEREENYGHQILTLNEKIRELQDELSFTKRNNSELEEENRSKKQFQTRVDHSNCMSMEKFKAKVN